MAVRQTTSLLPAIGVVAGLLLLGFAGLIVVSPPLHNAARRLQFGGGASFGYITTTRAPSSFDSSDSSSSSDLSSEPLKSSESGSLDSLDWNRVFPKLSAFIGSSMGPLTVWLILQALWAFLYNSKVVKPLGENGTLDERMSDSMQPEGQTDFYNSFLSCASDKWVCLQGLCCPMVRMAHTNAVSGVCGFWETLWCWCCCSWLSIGLGPSCLVVFWRLRLKNIMKESVVMDFCGTMLCPLISVCQMSTAVDSAMGYRTTGCCEYELYKGEALYEEPEDRYS